MRMKRRRLGNYAAADQLPGDLPLLISHYNLSIKL